MSSILRESQIKSSNSTWETSNSVFVYDIHCIYQNLSWISSKPIIQLCLYKTQLLLIPLYEIFKFLVLHKKFRNTSHMNQIIKIIIRKYLQKIGYLKLCVSFVDSKPSWGFLDTSQHLSFLYNIVKTIKYIKTKITNSSHFLLTPNRVCTPLNLGNQTKNYNYQKAFSSAP